MSSIIRRFFKFIQSNAHALLSRFEDPIKLAEQGIRDLKNDFDDSMKSVAEVKAIIISSKRELEVKKQIASDYERKALVILQKAKSNEIAEAEADRLASEALTKKNNALQEAAKLSTDIQNYEQMLQNLEGKVLSLKNQIKSWEGELTTLKARHKVAKSTAKINQQLASIGSESTTAMLQDMKTKIQEEESLALAYEDMTYLTSNIDKEIDKVTEGSYSNEVQASLAELKAKMLPDNSACKNSTEGDSLAEMKAELEQNNQ